MIICKKMDQIDSKQFSCEIQSTLHCIVGSVHSVYTVIAFFVIFEECQHGCIDCYPGSSLHVSPLSLSVT